MMMNKMNNKNLKSLSSNVLAFFCFLFVLFAFCSEANACNQIGKDAPTSNLYLNVSQQTWSYGEKKHLPEITVGNCKGLQGSFLQIVKGVLTYSSESYNAQLYLNKSIERIESCKTSDSSLTNFNNELKSVYVKKGLHIINQCVGMAVTSTTGEPLTPVETPSCSFSWETPEKKRALFKGDNCAIRNPKGSYKISPVILRSCFEDPSINTEFMETEGQILANYVRKDSQDPNKDDVDAISEKIFRIHSQPENIPQIKTEKFQNSSDSEFPIQRTTDYHVDADFGQLTIDGQMGSSTMSVKAQYILKNTSLNFYCNHKGQCSSGASFRAPVVFNHKLNLIKKDDLSNKILVGRWMSGSIVPSQWQGLDGSSTYNSIYIDANAGLLNSEIGQVKDGDILQLTSALLNPNSGPRTYIQYFFNSIRTKEVKKRGALRGPVGAVHEIPELDILKFKSSLTDLEFDNILTSRPYKKVKDLSQSWPVKFSRYCLDMDQKQKCTDMTLSAELIELNTFFEVHIKNKQIELKPLKTYKENILGLTKNHLLTKMMTVNCQ